MNIPEALLRLPEPKEIQRLPRQYLINVIATVVGEAFAQWVTGKIEERNTKIAEQKSAMV